MQENIKPKSHLQIYRATYILSISTKHGITKNANLNFDFLEEPYFNILLQVYRKQKLRLFAFSYPVFLFLLFPIHDFVNDHNDVRAQWELGFQTSNSSLLLYPVFSMCIY